MSAGLESRPLGSGCGFGFSRATAYLGYLTYPLLHPRAFAVLRTGWLARHIGYLGTYLSYRASDL